MGWLFAAIPESACEGATERVTDGNATFRLRLSKRPESVASAVLRRQARTRAGRSVWTAWDTGTGDEVRSKRGLILGARIAVSLVMLGVLVWRVPSFDASELIPEWNAATIGWLAGAAALTLVGILLSALRWQTVLGALGLHARTRRLLSHYMAGQFVSNVLPTTIGGDVLRVSRLSRDNGESPASFASVVLERLTGWLVLPVITFVGFIVNPGLRHLGTATQVALASRLGRSSPSCWC